MVTHFWQQPNPMKRYSFLLLCGALLTACGSVDPGDLPPNPYDAIVYPPDEIETAAPDSNTLVGLHQYIFSRSCAVPGCHDGHFEPDFRTIQSTYETLVYQPVIKNTQDFRYAFRVVPQDLDASWLYNRVTTENQTLGRMPLYDNPLTAGQLTALASWIMAGAPDAFGQVNDLPNVQPRFKAVAAYQDFSGFPVRIDTFRNEDFEPFGAKHNVPTRIYFAMEDDSTALGDLQNVEIAYGHGINQFTSFQPVGTLQASYSPTGLTIPDFYGPGEPETFYWSISTNTGNWPVNELTALRLSLNDGSHAEDWNFPRDSHPQAYKLYMSVYVVP